MQARESGAGEIFVLQRVSESEYHLPAESSFQCASIVCLGVYLAAPGLAANFRSIALESDDMAVL